MKLNLENLKKGWTEAECVEGWVFIYTEYWRQNGDGIAFTYSEKLGTASDDGDTDFEVGDLRDHDWYKNEKVKKILDDNNVKFDSLDGVSLVKEIKSIDDLYIFGKALNDIEQLF